MRNSRGGRGGGTIPKLPGRSRQCGRDARGRSAPPTAVEKLGKVASPHPPRTSRLVLDIVSLIDVREILLIGGARGIPFERD